MTHFIPVDQAKATTLAALITEETRLSPEDFVKFYNTGLINRKNEQVEAIVQELTTTFKDIVKKGGALAFITEEEVLFTEVETAASLWLAAVRLRSVFEEQVQAGTVAEDTVVYVGAGGRRVYSEAGDELFTERIGDSAEELAALVARFSTVEQEADDKPSFRVSDFLKLDFSFVRQVHGLLV